MEQGNLSGLLVSGVHEKAKNVVFLHVGRVVALLDDFGEDPVHFLVGPVALLERGKG